jgi:hypothetical protein
MSTVPFFRCITPATNFSGCKVSSVPVRISLIVRGSPLESQVIPLG